MSIPFYSPEIRDTLLMIIENHDGQEDGEDGAIINKMQTKLRHGYHAIRGKWSGGEYSYASSSDDDDVVDKLANISEDDESSISSTLSNRSSTGLVEETGDDNKKEEESRLNARGGGRASAISSKPRIKKSQIKDGKNELLQRMGRPPTVLLPFETLASSYGITGGDATRKAIEIPSVLLPTNYLRDNPNWKVTSVAQILLSHWERLNNCTITSSSPSNTDAPTPTIIVVLLQSGRFASAVYSMQPHNNNNNRNPQNTSPIMTMIAHKTSTRYTVRKGQGGSQSNFDQSKHKAKSIGAQLRREGERQLRQDVHETWNKWRKMGYVSRAVGVYVSCPKSMRRDYLYNATTTTTISSTSKPDDANTSSSTGQNGLLDKKDGRWKNIPLDVGRPTLDATSAVLECLMSCTTREMTEEEYRDGRRIRSPLCENIESGGGKQNEDQTKTNNNVEDVSDIKENQQETIEVEVQIEVKPCTPLHEAIHDGDLNRLIELLDLLDLKESQEKEGGDETTTTEPIITSCKNNANDGLVQTIDYDINTGGGPECFTPLHLASSSTHTNAPALISALLVHGHANPCAVDARGRPPYFLAASDKHRESFRLARGALGEDYCPWEEGAKVGPALSETDIQLKKAKALEKKRRQRARQKETRAIEKMEAERAQAEEQARLDKQKEEEDAKRIRDGLQPKSGSGATNICDFCQTMVKGKRRSQMFQRLDYAYCSTECVKKHQRELMAAAAMSRFGGGGGE